MLLLKGFNMISIRSTQLLAIVMMACSTSNFADTAKIGQSEGKLNIVAWPDYLENGASDKN